MAEYVFSVLEKFRDCDNPVLVMLNDKALSTFSKEELVDELGKNGISEVNKLTTQTEREKVVDETSTKKDQQPVKKRKIDAGAAPPFYKAVDVGCGTGKSTRPLAKYFKHVIGVDVSQAMLDIAKKTTNMSNIDYSIGSGESIPCIEKSVNLVTVAAAAHWFDPINAFYEECDRILVPGGCIALYQFGFSQFPLHPELEDIFTEFFNSFLEEGHTSDRWKPSMNNYASFDLPYDNTVRILNSIKIERYVSILDLIGFVYTWSGVQNYLRTNPNGNERIEEFQKRMHTCVGTSRPVDTAMVWWIRPIFVLLCKKPKT